MWRIWTLRLHGLHSISFLYSLFDNILNRLFGIMDSNIPLHSFEIQPTPEHWDESYPPVRPSPFSPPRLCPYLSIKRNIWEAGHFSAISIKCGLFHSFYPFLIECLTFIISRSKAWIMVKQANMLKRFYTSETKAKFFFALNYTRVNTFTRGPIA